MTGRICLITGSTSGIGEATAHALAAMGATVVVHGRNVGRCDDVVGTIQELSGNPNVESVVADISTLDGVRDLAAQLHARFDRLHVLINNAGAMFPDYRENADGFEMTFAVNHLAPFLLTNLVLDLLRAGAPSRVVNVSSGTHRRVSLDFDDLHSRKVYEPRAVYARTKLMNMLFTRELSRRLDGTGVTVNALSPGIVSTRFGVKDGMGEEQQSIMARGMPVEQGARTSVYVATAPELADTTGGYFVESLPAELMQVANDDHAARRLWEISADLVGL